MTESYKNAAERIDAKLKGHVVLVREIITLPRDKDGMFIQPDELTPKIAVMVEHNRLRASKKYNYADEYCGDATTVDPNANYNCGEGDGRPIGCNQANGKHCLLVSDDDKEPDENGDYPPLEINAELGSCDVYENVRAGDAELLCNRLPKSIAGYVVRKGPVPAGQGQVFSCNQCWKAKKTKWAIELDRGFWCGATATTVQKKACCALNGAPTF